MKAAMKKVLKIYLLGPRLVWGCHNIVHRDERGDWGP